MKLDLRTGLTNSQMTVVLVECDKIHGHVVPYNFGGLLQFCQLKTQTNHDRNWVHLLLLNDKVQKCKEQARSSTPAIESLHECVEEEGRHIAGTCHVTSVEVAPNSIRLAAFNPFYQRVLSAF